MDPDIFIQFRMKRKCKLIAIFYTNRFSFNNRKNFHILFSRLYIWLFKIFGSMVTMTSSLPLCKASWELRGS